MPINRNQKKFTPRCIIVNFLKLKAKNLKSSERDMTYLQWRNCSNYKGNLVRNYRVQKKVAQHFSDAEK